MNIVLKLRLFSIQGLIGMLTHMTSMNPVVNHWTVEAEIPKARIKVGYAVDNDDWLIDMVNVPTNKVKMNQKRLYGRPF